MTTPQPKLNHSEKQQAASYLGEFYGVMGKLELLNFISHNTLAILSGHTSMY